MQITHKTCWKFPGKQKTKVVCPPFEARTQPHLWEIANTRRFWETEQRSTETEMEGQHKGTLEEIPTEDVAQDRKYWMTEIMAGPAQGDGQERWEKGENVVASSRKPCIFLPRLTAAMFVVLCLHKVPQSHRYSVILHVFNASSEPSVGQLALQLQSYVMWSCDTCIIHEQLRPVEPQFTVASFK